MTLAPYQFQLSGVTFGRNTLIPVSKADPQPYNVNQQDFQIPRTDENRFGIDTLAPGPIIFTMAVLENFAINQLAHAGGYVNDDLFFARGTVLAQLAKVWKAKETRSIWGQSLPLLCCTSDSTVLRVYGRPGKFQYQKIMSDRETFINVQAEFRRNDTFAHSDIEYYIGHPTLPGLGLPAGAAPVTAPRGAGDGDSWLRFLFVGPLTHPIVQYGDNVLELNSSIPAGVQIEVSSYPWARHVVDSLGINRRTEVIGDTKYLDQLQFAANDSIPVSWTATGTTAESGLYFLWREAYNVI